MKKLLLAALLSSLGCGCASIGDGPPDAPGLPSQGVVDVGNRCGPIEAYQAKWQSALRMSDWRVVIVCTDIPDSENAWALSFVEAHRKEMAVAIDPDSPNMELTVIHELSHGLFTYLREADSELVEENFAVLFSELLKGCK